jgi:hypothetical protein
VFDRSWLWEKATKKLRPSAHPTSKAGIVAGLPAGFCELQLLLGIHSPLLQAISAGFFSENDQERRETRYQRFCTSNQPSTNTYISKTPGCSLLLFGRLSLAPLPTAKHSPFHLIHDCLRLALRAAPKIFPTANNLTQTPQLQSHSDNCRGREL